MVKVTGACHMTPWHPVRMKGEWHFPISLHKPQEQECERVYNFVLDRGHILLSHDNVECVTLGHGFTDSPVVQHDYFGTQRVIEDLKAQAGWAAGLVKLGTEAFTRGEDGRVISLKKI